jgi:hypothetical protein
MSGILFSMPVRFIAQGVPSKVAVLLYHKHIRRVDVWGQDSHVQGSMHKNFHFRLLAYIHVFGTQLRLVSPSAAPGCVGTAPPIDNPLTPESK